MLKKIFLGLLISYSTITLAIAKNSQFFHNGVELLIFKTDPQKMKQIIRVDHELWTKYLSQYGAFRAKQVGINPDKPGYLYIIINWDSYNEWKSIPKKNIEKFTKQANKIIYEKTGAKLELIKSIDLKTTYTVDRCHSPC